MEIQLQIRLQIQIVLLPGKKQKQKSKVRNGDNPQYMESFLFHRITPGMLLKIFHSPVGDIFRFKFR